MFAILRHKAPANASVGTSTAEILAVNENRRYASFINTSANKIFLAFGFPAEVNKGTFVAADGGSYEMSDVNLSFQAVNAIADVASSNLAIQEADK